MLNPGRGEFDQSTKVRESFDFDNPSNLVGHSNEVVPRNLVDHSKLVGHSNEVVHRDLVDHKQSGVRSDSAPFGPSS